MVLIAASVCTKSGKIILSRQFVEMTKVRIEGLLAAFPKLIPAGTQHTFVETDSVRYVYQPMEKLYMVLITTKTSNILEDLETLRLFARVIPEYCQSMDETDIGENAFNLIFAFDEIVALGYRESVNLSQIRTFVEMDSHEERVYQALRQTQEREAKNKMREKAKELHRQKVDAQKKGSARIPSFGSSGGFGNSMNFNNSSIVTDLGNDVKPPSYNIAVPRPSPGRSMKLGGKNHDVDTFVDQLKSEGEKVSTASLPSSQCVTKSTNLKQDTNDVHLRLEEKLNVQLDRHGGVKNFELLGLISLYIGNEKWNRIRVQLVNNASRSVQFQTHPYVDRELFKNKAQIGLKQPNKPFPVQSDVGVLKWRLHGNTDSYVPLLINCWPSETGGGKCDVNIEYELLHENLQLADVTIVIPIRSGCNPIVGDCDGSYTHESRRNQLLWNLPLIDSSNKNGALEFSAPNSSPDDFFPLSLNFSSITSYSDVKVSEVTLVDNESSVPFSLENELLVDKYEIVSSA